MSEKETVHEAYALITRKANSITEVLLVESQDGVMSLPGDVRREDDIDLPDVIRRVMQKGLNLWPEHYGSTAMGISKTAETEDGAIIVAELFSVEIRPGVAATAMGDVRAVHWRTLGEVNGNLPNERQRHMFMMAKERIGT